MRLRIAVKFSQRSDSSPFLRAQIASVNAGQGGEGEGLMISIPRVRLPQFHRGCAFNTLGRLVQYKRICLVLAGVHLLRSEGE